MSTKSITVIAIIIVLCYVMYNILTYYDFGLSYLGSYIAFYMFMLASSLVLPSTDLDLSEGTGEKEVSYMDSVNAAWKNGRLIPTKNEEPGL